jgi:CheY-like chemotaxis protein
MTVLPAKNILLIDDDPVANLVNQRIIECHFDFKTIVFTDAHMALQQLKQWLLLHTMPLPEIIFLDIDMPEMNGWEFLEELHKLPMLYLAKCRIVILTSSIDLDDIEKSKSYKAVFDFVSKPLTAEKLKSLV